MSFFSRYISQSLLQRCHIMCKQKLSFQRIRSENLTTDSSLYLLTSKYKLGLSVGDLLCFSRLVLTSSVFSLPSRGIGIFKTLCSTSHNIMPTNVLSFAARNVSSRPFHDDSRHERKFPNDEDDVDEQQPLKLMDYPGIIWPSPWKLVRNYMFSFLIRSYFDEKFSISGFLSGAEQAVSVISNYISNGQFEALEGLVTREAIQEVRQHYMRLNLKQRNFVAVTPKDFFSKFVFEIGLIFDDNTNQRFVEITTVFQGYHGLEDLKLDKVANLMDNMHKKPEMMYICNYRFIREFTKGKEDDWTVNKLNHFLPTEHVRE